MPSPRQPTSDAQASASTTHMFRSSNAMAWSAATYTKPGCIKSLQAKIDADATRYRKNHAALSQLATTLHPVGWEVPIPPSDSDIRAQTQLRGKGQRRPKDHVLDLAG
ncbi:hypothetical protein BD779DRAFT_1673629 [Infundibulicybe gibba]|nr:hypothetical protein BD779DRAFT_1673629 [Infundibulicybe gibba]